MNNESGNVGGGGSPAPTPAGIGCPLAGAAGIGCPLTGPAGIGYPLTGPACIGYPLAGAAGNGCPLSRCRRHRSIHWQVPQALGILTSMVPQAMDIL